MNEIAGETMVPGRSAGTDASVSVLARRPRLGEANGIGMSILKLLDELPEAICSGLPERSTPFRYGTPDRAICT